jgi:hypothetical protein
MLLALQNVPGTPSRACADRVGHHACVATARAELSSIASTLTDLSQRVTALAERSRDGGEADLAAELFAVERDLRGALRRLSRASSEGRNVRS